MSTGHMNVASARFLNLARKLVRRVPVGSLVQREILDAALSKLEEVAYTRLRDLGFCPNGIIDVGAHQGDWIRAVRQIFPNPPALLIEAREEQRTTLNLLCSELSNIQFKIALLGPEPKASVQFQVHGSGSSLFAERSDARRSVREMQMSTLDDVVSSASSFKSPILLKLDVQGAELEVLRGAEKTLAISEIVQLEVALLHFNEGAPSSAEVVAFMDAKGFAIYDVVGFVRPNATDLVQVDLLFAKKTSPLRGDYFHFQP